MLYLVLCLCYLLKIAVADLPNPVFTEIAFTVNTSDEYSMNNFLYSTAATVSSQDFQAVLLNSEEYQQTNRVLLDFGYGCQNTTTMDSVRQLNFNNTDLSVLKSMETIALVKRGQCEWSDKLSVINSLSNANQLNVTAALIYDNQTYSDISIKTSLYQANIDFPSYLSPLPSNRSALSMSDNNLSQSSISVYFVPYVYGNALKGKINSTYDSAQPTIRTLWTVTALLEQEDSSNGFIGSIKGYLAYIIALAAIFLIGIIFLRWWRIRRARDSYASDIIVHNGIHLQPRNNRIDPLPVDIVNTLPIKQYKANVCKNVNCVICLDDFVPEKTDVRILPCGHGFCVLCIGNAGSIDSGDY
ncbi:unnamed protein product [Rhizopus stolonifer]